MPLTACCQRHIGFALHLHTEIQARLVLNPSQRWQGWAHHVLRVLAALPHKPEKVVWHKHSDQEVALVGVEESAEMQV